MLLIVSPEEKYINDLLLKFDYNKKNNLNNINLYSCNYKSHQFLIATTGYGKVNIASSLINILNNYPIKVILLIGTAGSIDNKNDIFNAVIFNKAVQYDVDFSPIGYDVGVIPKMNNLYYEVNGDIKGALQRSSIACGISYTNDLIASADMFVNNINLSNSIKEEYNAGAVDAESGVVGQFCYMNNISYAGIKIISNFAHNMAAKQYKLYDDKASLIAQKITYKFIREYYY